ncbi:cell envelope biogenesis protein OmpA [Spongiimicrobium sp. 3-5]|uniref:cell envelope biogenesis protein OmpA n=1 Tax=Spongiimicrobium sp. 3-5 TaxID=3332596 RepID=UPI00397F7338
MYTSITYNVAFACIITFFCCSLSAQNAKHYESDNWEVREGNRRIDHYLELSKLGYKDSEIFEDLGNANFLIENYETAIYWYDKLRDHNRDGVLKPSYEERYEYALEKTKATASTLVVNNRDWVAAIKEDYQVNKKPVKTTLASSNTNSKYKSLDFLQNNGTSALEDMVEQQIPRKAGSDFLSDKTLGYQNAYKTPISVTADGNTAYFSRASLVKPLYGVFSKEQMVHKIYRADKINGQWKNIREVAVNPKYSSALHPTISDDGKRLFFASNMPGTFGKYDIYVSKINADGTCGVAKNLGTKVNTDKNDLYPNIVGGTSLFFASDGHKGHGGLDVFMAQVGSKKVGWSVNLGSSINSIEDDFSIALTEKGVGYVMSNRGREKGAVYPVAFSLSTNKNDKLQENEGYNILEVLNSDAKTNYTTSIFEDD